MMNSMYMKTDKGESVLIGGRSWLRMLMSKLCFEGKARNWKNTVNLFIAYYSYWYSMYNRVYFLQRTSGYHRSFPYGFKG